MQIMLHLSRGLAVLLALVDTVVPAQGNHSGHNHGGNQHAVACAGKAACEPCELNDSFSNKPIAGYCSGDEYLPACLPQSVSTGTSRGRGANESGENACAIGTLPDLAMSTPAYDPTLVDWRSAQMAIEFVANKEKRFCNFAIRAHFHDAGSLGTAPSNPKFRGLDGSLLLDKFEFLQPENAHDAFAITPRVVLQELARFYGMVYCVTIPRLKTQEFACAEASFADLLNLAAFTCVRSLGGVVDIPQACDAAGLGMHVGKLDAAFQFSEPAARTRVDDIPGPFDDTSIWVSYWIETLNPVAESAQWQFTTREALALMGSHTLFDTQACSTSSPQVTIEAPPSAPLSDDACSGPQRMFEWSNAYFKDALSGRCEPRTLPPDSTDGTAVSMEDFAKGRDPTEAEEAILEECVFSSEEGRIMNGNLNCVVQNAIEEFVPDYEEEPKEDSRFTDWYPDETRAPCCGFHCQMCPGGLGADANPFYCANDSPAGTSFWFYTWQDCDMINAVNNPDTYCKQDTSDCSTFPEAALKSELRTMATAYSQFATDTVAWQTEYALGHCKLSNLGSRYSSKKAQLLPLLNTCKGELVGGVCSTDPQNGVVRKSGGSLGAPLCCDEGCSNTLDLSTIISADKCSGCASAV